MDSIYSTMFGILMGRNNRGEVVGRDEVNGYTIDTCYTVDQGWETGVWKGDGEIIIVGRYASKEDAAEGHDDWCEACKVNPVGAWSIQEEEYVNF